MSYIFDLSAGLGVENHLCAAEQRQRFAGGFVGDDGVPDVGVSTQVNGRGGAADGAFAQRAQVVGFELDGGKAFGACGQVGNAAVARAGVGQRDDAAGMQKAVGCHQLGFDWHFSDGLFAADVGDDDAQVPGQMVDAKLIEVVCVVGGAHGADDSALLKNCASAKRINPAPASRRIQP